MGEKASKAYDLAFRIKWAEKQIRALSVEITHLYGVLSRLHLMASRFEIEVSEVPVQQRSLQIDHIHACYSTLDSILSLLRRNNPSSA